VSPALGAMAQVDLVIVGAGFGGSLMAMIGRRLGLSVVLLEQGRHPRMAIGESTTPLSNLVLERLCARYDLPRIAPLTKWGSWQNTYPKIGCGLKRGFTFFHRDGELLVAASPHDTVADTHWFRADVDHFLVLEAQQLGVDYRDCVCIESVEIGEQFAALAGRAGEERFCFETRLLIDATGPRGFLHHALHLEESPLPGLPATKSLYSHFTGVSRSETSRVGAPYPVDDAAVHHVFDGGWIWVLRFNNGITSAGVVATRSLAAEFALSEGEAAWQRLLARVPALEAQFKYAIACQPFRYVPSVSFRSRMIAGDCWAMLPSAGGFVDPLLSSGFVLNLLGIERLAEFIGGAGGLLSYAEHTEADLLAVTRLIGALYATMGNFPAFTAVSLLYFAAVSFSETAFRLGKPELAPGFLLPGAELLLERAYTLGDAEGTRAFTDDVLRVIESFNLGRFGDPALRNHYPVRAEDLLEARSKLGATRDEIVAMLERTGFS
jgi:FADH2 O2-dependent halogenase